MNILQVNTGDEKLDEAYKRMQIHISQFDTFEAFYSYFKDIVKSNDYENLTKWLLKVLHHEFRHGRSNMEVPKHDFDLLLENLSQKDRLTMENWLKNKMHKVRG